MDVSRAQLSNLGDEVELVDPGFPWTVRVRLSEDADRPVVLGLCIEARPEEGEEAPALTSTVLAQVPVRQLASVAASAVLGEGEAQYRMLAAPRPPGVRSWPPDHFQRVARVAAWARQTGRPGGAAGAVAEFWGVHYRTARRWISRLP
jgi:hypothetical protein